MKSLKILFITHQLSRTGAPQVLLDMIRLCVAAGHRTVVITMEDGPLRSGLEAINIPVTLIPSFHEAADSLIPVFSGFDLAVVNTLVAHEAIPLCSRSGVCTLWWIHEHAAYFDLYREAILSYGAPAPNIHVYGVSPVTCELIKEKLNISPSLLSFGIQDLRGSLPAKKADSEKLRFLCIGLYAYVKGQDLLADAVEKLMRSDRRPFYFDFFGNTDEVDPAVFDPVKCLSERRENIRIRGSIDHLSLMHELASSDYLIVPSRKEPMSAVTVEAMMCGVPCIISDVCGVCSYMEKGSDSLIFPSGDADALAAAIQNAPLPGSAEYMSLAENARKCYERNFSMEVFAANVLAILSRIS